MVRVQTTVISLVIAKSVNELANWIEVFILVHGICTQCNYTV